MFSKHYKVRNEVSFSKGIYYDDTPFLEQKSSESRFQNLRNFVSEILEKSESRFQNLRNFVSEILEKSQKISKNLKKSQKISKNLKKF